MRRNRHVSVTVDWYFISLEVYLPCGLLQYIKTKQYTVQKVIVRFSKNLVLSYLPHGHAAVDILIILTSQSNP